MGSMPIHHGVERKQHKASSLPFFPFSLLWIGTSYTHSQEHTGWQRTLTSFCWGKRKEKIFLSKSHVTVYQCLGKTGRHSSIQGHQGGLERAEEGTVPRRVWSAVTFSFKRSLLLLFPQTGLFLYFWGQSPCGVMSSSPAALLVIRGVRAVSTGQSVPGLFSARTPLIPAQLPCSTFPKNEWAISQKQCKSKDFLTFHRLWTLDHHTLFSSGNLLLSCAPLTILFYISRWDTTTAKWNHVTACWCLMWSTEEKNSRLRKYQEIPTEVFLVTWINKIEERGKKFSS